MAAATPYLVANQQRILTSTLIQIVHVHPDNAHRIRSDLDHEDLVIDNYPIELAKPILGRGAFEPQPAPTLKRKRSESPLRRTDSAPIPDTIVLAPPARLLKASTSLRGGDLPDVQRTPQRQLLPPVKLEPVDTACTITPGGNEFSPLKREVESPRSPLALLKDTNTIPVAMFSPPKTRVRAASSRGRGRGRVRTTHITHQPRNPPPLIYFDPIPRSVDGSSPKMTVVLRHSLPLQGLKDFFEWCLRSTRGLKMEYLDRWLVNFHDWERVEEIKEVCVALGLAGYAKHCDRMLDGWKDEVAKVHGRRRITIQALLT